MVCTHTHIYTLTHTFRQKYPLSPVPVCFQTEFPNLRRCRGEVGTARAYSLCALRFLSWSPGILFRVFIKLKSWTTHCFPLVLGREQKRIEKKTRGKRLSNYFKQHTKLKHCAEPSKGQHPERCGFPAVWGEGNAKGISAELTLKGERER